MLVEAFGRTFELVNEEKVTRAIEGTTDRDGMPKGGVGSDAAPEVIIARYDQLGGLIRMDGDRVKMGCFYKFDRRNGTPGPIAKPVVILQFLINGNIVDVPADEPLPMLVRAAKLAEQGKMDEDEEEKTDEEQAPAPSQKSATLIGTGKKNTK